MSLLTSPYKWIGFLVTNCRGRVSLNVRPAPSCQGGLCRIWVVRTICMSAAQLSASPFRSLLTAPSILEPSLDFSKLLHGFVNIYTITKIHEFLKAPSILEPSLTEYCASSGSQGRQIVPVSFMQVNIFAKNFQARTFWYQEKISF